MNALFWLIRKDLSIFFSDFTGAVITVIMPAILALLLGSIFQPPDEQASMALLVVEEKPGDSSQKWLAELKKRKDLAISTVTREEAFSQVSRGLAPAAIFLPAELDTAMTAAALLEGTPPEIHIVEDPARQMEGMRIRGALMETGATIALNRFLKPTFLHELLVAGDEKIQGNSSLLGDTHTQRALRATEALRELIAPLQGLPALPIRLKSPGELFLTISSKPVERKTQNIRTGYHAHSHAFAGMICMFLLFFALERSKQELRERENGTHFRVRTTPATDLVVLTGSTLSTAIIAFISALSTYAIGWLLADVTIKGSSLGFILVLGAMSLMVGTFGVLMSQLNRSAQSLTAVGTLLVLMMSFLGGAWAPSFVLSDTLQWVGGWMPTTFATHGLAALTWRGLGLNAALSSIGGLLLFALLFFGFALLFSKRRGNR